MGKKNSWQEEWKQELADRDLPTLLEIWMDIQRRKRAGFVLMILGFLVAIAFRSNTFMVIVGCITTFIGYLIYAWIGLVRWWNSRPRWDDDEEEL